MKFIVMCKANLNGNNIFGDGPKTYLRIFVAKQTCLKGEKGGRGQLNGLFQKVSLNRTIPFKDCLIIELFVKFQLLQIIDVRSIILMINDDFCIIIFYENILFNLEQPILCCIEVVDTYFSIEFCLRLLCPRLCYYQILHMYLCSAIFWAYKIFFLLLPFYSVYYTRYGNQCGYRNSATSNISQDFALNCVHPPKNNFIELRSLKKQNYKFCSVSSIYFFEEKYNQKDSELVWPILVYVI
eukprot:TRINITY_DN13764_c2_g1_i1.p1 TRINITY_DN13764_c2_g1~~TRINITY_DN13764_c2_g1_i1.p1  ORF type:complete len:240 (+),score=-8.45 TRINITY_DN13764_c2_g1_i1:178-897(+)